MELKDKFKLKDEYGQETTYDVLFTFDNEETNKSYVVYTDNTFDDAGNVQVYASVYYPESDNNKLDPVETEREWQIIDKILETIQEEVRKQTETSNEE
ncbi:MAG TPA: DUF1292 domain-containing protein [Candidatus Onthousia faecavium]|nr:DUF1292 domain-containing protein [Candidatus Onthousia faecavium]